MLFNASCHSTSHWLWKTGCKRALNNIYAARLGDWNWHKPARARREVRRFALRTGYFVGLSHASLRGERIAALHASRYPAYSGSPMYQIGEHEEEWLLARILSLEHSDLRGCIFLVHPNCSIFFPHSEIDFFENREIFFDWEGFNRQSLLYLSTVQIKNYAEHLILRPSWAQHGARTHQRPNKTKTNEHLVYVSRTFLSWPIRFELY